MQHQNGKPSNELLRVRCTHCRASLIHDPQDGHACPHCGSQMAMYNGAPMMIAKNGSDGIPLHKLDPKKKKVLIPRF